MDCTEFLERYSEYDDSLIAPAESERFRAHMAECPACTRYDRVLRKGRMLARQLPVVEPTDAFGPRLHMRLGGDPLPGAGRRSVGGSWQAASAPPVMALLLAVAAAVALVGQRVGTGGSSSAEGNAPAHVASAPMDGAAGRAGGSARGLPPSVLAMAPAEVRPWASERVDRAASSSYSPLVMGPPAYRAGPPRIRVSISTYPTLD